MFLRGFLFASFSGNLIRDNLWMGMGIGMGREVCI